MESEGVLLPVVSLAIKYKKPVYYDDLIIIQTELVKLPTASIDFSYKLMNQQREILATASTTLAFINKITDALSFSFLKPAKAIFVPLTYA